MNLWNVTSELHYEQVYFILDTHIEFVMLTNIFSTIPASPIKPFHEGLECRPESLQSSISLTYLGTAGFIFSGLNRTIVVDPYVTRPNLLQHGFSKLKSDEALVKQWIPMQMMY